MSKISRDAYFVWGWAKWFAKVSITDEIFAQLQSDFGIGMTLKTIWIFGYSTIYSLRLRDSRDSQDSETPETPRLPRLRDSRGFCHITFQFSFISDLPLFQIFQILQILKWKWKWKDPTFAIFLKNMGFKDVEYNIPETLRLPRLPRLWDSETKRGQNHKM